MSRLTVVVVSYNSRDFLDDCLRAVEAERADTPLEVVVVDNASTDLDVPLLVQVHPELHVIVNESNLGFSTACNIGLRAHPADFYLLLNPDCIVGSGAIAACLKFLERESRCGIVGCRVENPDGSLQLACRRSIPTASVALFRFLGFSRLFPRSRRFGRYNFTYLDDRLTHEVEAVSGSFMMFRAAVLEQTGGLDEQFFLYGEDLDFCFRAAKAGWRIFYFADARVTHHKRQSSRQNADLANYHFFNAMKLFYRKHFHSNRHWLRSKAVETTVDLAYRLSEIRRRLGARHKVGSDR